MKVGIVGGSGYTGAELLRLCARHPDLDVVWASAAGNAGAAVTELYPNLAPAYESLRFVPLELGSADGLDLVFLALPHGQSQGLVAELAGRVGTIVDLSADFRLADPSLYRVWYGVDHAAPELLAQAVYGLPELTRADLVGARLVAAAGCYPTAAALALAPLVRAGAIEAVGIVVDAASGVSGAGRVLDHRTQFAAADGDFCAYGLLNHRHTPEIEQAIGARPGGGPAIGARPGGGPAIGARPGGGPASGARPGGGPASGAQVLFTPHLAPMTRGILATCYARPAGSDVPDPLEVLGQAYAGEPFVHVSERSPSTKATLGSNCAQLTARYDPRTGWVIAVCALDNLVKGAAGQAVQCANLALGLAETAGLDALGVYP